MPSAWLSRSRATLRAEHAGDVADDRIDDHHRREFAAGQDVIADADFVGDDQFADAGVDAFIMPAEQNQAIQRRQLDGDLMRKDASARRHENHRGGVRLRLHRLDRAHEHVSAQEHPAAAAVGRIVDGVMLIEGVVADIVQAQVEQVPGRAPSRAYSRSWVRRTSTGRASICRFASVFPPRANCNLHPAAINRIICQPHPLAPSPLT